MHAPHCRRVFWMGQWMHTATCESAAANLFYAREQGLSAPGQAEAEPFPFDTIPSLAERAMRYGIAMKELLS